MLYLTETPLLPLNYHVYVIENIIKNGAFALLEQMLHFLYYLQKYSKLLIFAAASPTLYYHFEPKFYVNFRQSEVFLNCNIHHTT